MSIEQNYWFHSVESIWFDLRQNKWVTWWIFLGVLFTWKTIPFVESKQKIKPLFPLSVHKHIHLPGSRPNIETQISDKYNGSSLANSDSGLLLLLLPQFNTAPTGLPLADHVQTQRTQLGLRPRAWKRSSTEIEMGVTVGKWGIERANRGQRKRAIRIYLCRVSAIPFSHGLDISALLWDGCGRDMASCSAQGLAVSQHSPFYASLLLSPDLSFRHDWHPTHPPLSLPS